MSGSKFGVVKLSDNLIDGNYTLYSKQLGEAIISGDFSEWSLCLKDDVELIIIDKKTIKGINNVLDYWEGWREKYFVTKQSCEFEVVHSNYYSHSCLLMKSMLAAMNIENGKVNKIVFSGRYIAGGIYSHHDDLVKDYPFQYSYIKRFLEPLNEDDGKPVVKSNRIPCLSCGISSENLNWYSSYITTGIHGYPAQISICPNCGRVIEYRTVGRFRLEKPAVDELDILEKYADCWNNHSIGNLWDYLSDDFRYSSHWVFEELDKDGYLNYFYGKLKKIDETRSFVKARVENNFLVVNQDGNNVVIEVKFDNGKIIRADMSPASFYGLPDKEYLSPSKSHNFDLYGKYTFDCDSPSDDTSDDKDSCETINKQGITAVNREGDLNKGVELFKLAASKGSHNAMINLFSMYWNNEEYREACNMLENMIESKDPSLKCLWNYAFLCFMGDDYPNHTINGNVEKAKDILARIIQCDPNTVCKSDKNVINRAIALNDYIGESNIYADKGIYYHDLLLSSVVKTDTIKNKYEVFRALSSLSLNDGCYLGLRLAEKSVGMGDESNFYVYNDNGAEGKNVLSHLKLEPTKMAAWQVYLLKTSPTVMPVYWHGGYIVRKFIFNEADLMEIDSLKHLDFSALKDLNMIMPSVDIELDNETQEYKANIYCCYWNEWRGLVRGHVVLTIKDDSVTSYSNEKDFVLYEYNCGILY